MQTTALHYYIDLAKRVSSAKSGVQVLLMKEYFDDRTNDSDVWYKEIMPDYKIIPKNDLPEKCTFGATYTTVAMNPLLLLPWLKEQLDDKGVKFIRKEVGSIDEVRELTGFKIIINASGLGARKLAGDESVRSIRGQTMFVKTSFNESVMKEGSEYTYVIPRAESGGVIIGGIKSDRLDSEVDVDMKVDILKRINRITKGAFNDTDLGSVTDIVGFRPGREGKKKTTSLKHFFVTGSRFLSCSKNKILI